MIMDKLFRYSVTVLLSTGDRYMEAGLFSFVNTTEIYEAPYKHGHRD
jgi:hypothetical protein